MERIDYSVDKDLAPYVNCIMIGSAKEQEAHLSIPLYADGYPGIMFQKTQNNFYLYPKKKKLSELFLFGQTLEPASLEVKGPYEYIVIQLYPFASRYLLNIDPRELNDDCYDLLQLKVVKEAQLQQQLHESTSLENGLGLLFKLVRLLIQSHQVAANNQIEKAVSIIIQQEGQIKINDLLDQVFMTERTLERHFTRYTGLKPKQFARIIQFQCSMNRLSNSGYNSLLEVGLDSGFADQSHFIRTFKTYTGQTPSFYLNQLRQEA
jgi:AraC-like DNA-binding protein